MKRLLSLLLATALLLSGCTMGGRNTLRFGTAGIGGLYAQASAAIQRLAEADGAVEIEGKTTSGSAANIRLLSQDYLDAAIVQSDIAKDAYEGKNDFASSGPDHGFRAVAALYPEACHIVVRADSDIRSMDDLLGKTVSIGEAESGTELNAKQILPACGLTGNMVKRVNLDYTTAAQQLVSGEIDALFCTIGLGTTVINELAKQCEIRLLDVSESALGKLEAAYGYSACTIPAGTYPGQTEDVQTLGVKALVVVSSTVPHATVEALTALLFDFAKELQLSLPTNVDLTPESAVEGVGIPFHTGAAAYYASQGISVESAASEEG